MHLTQKYKSDRNLQHYDVYNIMKISDVSYPAGEKSRVQSARVLESDCVKSTDFVYC